MVRLQECRQQRTRGARWLVEFCDSRVLRVDCARDTLAEVCWEEDWAYETVVGLQERGHDIWGGTGHDMVCSLSGLA